MIVLNVEEMVLTSLLMCLGQILELEGAFVLEIVVFVSVVSEIAVLDIAVLASFFLLGVQSTCCGFFYIKVPLQICDPGIQLYGFACVLQAPIPPDNILWPPPLFCNFLQHPSGVHHHIAY